MYPTQALCRPLTSRVMARRCARLPRQLQQKRSMIAIKDHLYFAKATAEGPGRSGTVKSNGDHPLQFTMSLPRAAGGKGDGPNPEQLFAMGYSSCFLGAIQLAAARANKMEIGDMAKVHTNVFLGHPEDPNIDGFGLRVELLVEGCDDDSIISAANDFCPYSRAFQHGIEVQVKKA
ncbi:hypothetical protein QCA50_004140 [Cerrena zonata]|uniref:OsmC-like protein n=1 Tax=Cerrena zonata TaxID=2478898 RepID=A0AAW0GGF7_9APHY